MIQDNKSATLSCNNTQTLFSPIAIDSNCQDSRFRLTGDVVPTIPAKVGTGGNNGPMLAVVYDICSYASNSMKSSNPHSGIYEANTSRTLDLNGGSPACNQGGMAIVQAAGFLSRNSENARSIGYEEEKAPTIRSGMIPDICATVSAKWAKGTGGPSGDECQNLVVTQKRFGEYEPGVSAIMTGSGSGKTGENLVVATVESNMPENVATYQKVTGPLMANSHPGSYTGQDAYNDMFVTTIDCINHKENAEVSGTLCSKNKPGYSLNYQNPVRVGYSVRRLTPLECERLQDYPDGWTDIPGASDSARYKACGNSVAVCCPEYVLEGIKEVLLRDNLIELLNEFDFLN